MEVTYGAYCNIAVYSVFVAQCAYIVSYVTVCNEHVDR